MQSTIRLFKALPIADHNRTTENKELMKQTLSKGFVFAPDVLAHYSDTEYLTILVDEAYGRGSEELNQTFHKSFAKVRDASIEQLFFEQIMHYFTTYGAEHFGIYSEELVYIPSEDLNAPELTDDVRVVVIRGLTKEELKDKLMTLLSSGIALHERTIADALDVAQFVSVDESDLERIANKEVKAALYDHLGIVPSNPVEFLRFVVYRATERTLLIKNGALVSEIKGRNNTDVVKYFNIYDADHGLHRLAEVFYRFKPIFLAFRTNSALKRYVNRIRRLARRHHKPMQEDLLNSLTGRLKRGDGVNVTDFLIDLDQANLFRRIRLAYALKFRTTDADSILYRIRNGKSFATDFGFTRKEAARYFYDLTLGSITANIAQKVEGQKIFIPEGIHYGLPATEKQFTGNLPSGTWVEIGEDMVCGIHWENQDDHRIDLDLSISNATGKIGWDGYYRDLSEEIYFSGDLTDAPKPKGATEVFHIGQEARGVWLMNVNYYNFGGGEVDVPFKIVAASEHRRNITFGYTIDPNKIVALSNSVMDVKQKMLGIVVADDDSAKFYFAESNMGNSITSRFNRHSEHALKYLVNYYTNAISLNDVLVDAGAKLVDDAAEADIDLSPEVADKTTFIDLLTEGR